MSWNPSDSSGPLMLRLPVRHTMTDWMRKLVANVPISDSICKNTITMPLRIPTIRLTTKAMRIPTNTDVSELTIAYVAMTPARDMVVGIEMSNTPAESGMTNVRAAIAVMAFVLRIWRAVSASGNVSGTQIENTTIITIRT